MTRQSLLSSFATLMRASGPGAVNDEIAAEQSPAAEQGQRLIRAFASIRSPDVRQAIIDVVTVIAERPNWP